MASLRLTYAVLHVGLLGRTGCLGERITGLRCRIVKLGLVGGGKS